MDRIGNSPAASRKRRRDVAESKTRVASPTVDAEQHRRNPTRFVPSQLGMLSLSRAEVKQDIREISQDGPLGGNTGNGSFAKEVDGVLNMEWRKMDTKKEPTALPGAHIGVKTLRLRRWKSKPQRAQAELHRCNEQVSQLRTELAKLSQQQCQSEEQYFALREHYLTLLQMLREAGQGHDVFSEEMQKACIRLRSEYASVQGEHAAGSDSAMDDVEADGPSLVDASIRLSKRMKSLKSQLSSLEDEETALAERLGQNGHTTKRRDIPEDDPDVEESFWGAGKKDLPSVGDLVSTPYGNGYVTKVRTWNGFVRLSSPIAEVKLPFGRAYMCARQLKEAIRNPGELSDEELAQKWSRHSEIAKLCWQESPAQLNAESYEALTMDDLGLPFEADDVNGRHSSSKATTNAVYELAERILPGVKRLRQRQRSSGFQAEALKGVLQSIDAEASKTLRNLISASEDSEGSVTSDAVSSASAATRTRGRRPRKPLETVEEHGGLSHVESTDSSEASADPGISGLAVLAGGDSRVGSEVSRRHRDEHLQRCRERLFPLTAALLPRDMLPTGRSRLALNRVPLCASADASSSAQAVPVEEVDAYGGVNLPVPNGCTSLSDYVEHTNHAFKEMNDYELESVQYRSEISRENTRRNLLPKLFQASALKRLHEAGQRKAEILEATLQEYVSYTCPRSSEVSCQKQNMRDKTEVRALAAQDDRSVTLSAEEGDGDEDVGRRTPESNGSDLLIKIQNNHGMSAGDAADLDEHAGQSYRVNGVSGPR